MESVSGGRFYKLAPRFPRPLPVCTKRSLNRETSSNGADDGDRRNENEG